MISLSLWEIKHGLRSIFSGFYICITYALITLPWKHTNNGVAEGLSNNPYGFLPKINFGSDHFQSLLLLMYSLAVKLKTCHL